MLSLARHSVGCQTAARQSLRESVGNLPLDQVLYSFPEKIILYVFFINQRLSKARLQFETSQEVAACIT